MATLEHDPEQNTWRYNNGKVTVELRPLHRIHDEVYKEWSGMNFPTRRTRVHAWPYMMALRHLETPATNHGMETGDMIVAHFLNNAVTWRGEVARMVRAELKAWLEAYNAGLLRQRS